MRVIGVTRARDLIPWIEGRSDHEGSGNLPDFNFDVTPCGLDHFTCVADCSACPERPTL